MFNFFLYIFIDTAECKGRKEKVRGKRRRIRKSEERR